MSERLADSAAVLLFRGRSDGRGYAVKAGWAHHSRAAAQWHIAPENILVVGDTINDMNFAHNGGAIAVGVLSGVSSREQLAPAADYILDSVADVPALIRQLEQKGL